MCFERRDDAVKRRASSFSARRIRARASDGDDPATDRRTGLESEREPRPGVDAP